MTKRREECCRRQRTCRTTEEDEPARPEKKKGTAVRHYITVSAMRKLVGGIPSRRMCMQAMPAYPDALPQICAWPSCLSPSPLLLVHPRLPEAAQRISAGTAREGGLPATGPGAGNPGNKWPAALHDHRQCSVSCRESGDFRRACGSGEGGACTAA